MAPSPDYTLPLIAGRDKELLLKVRAVPGSSRDRVLGVHGDALRISVRAPPLRGKANAALVEVISSWLGIHRTAVSIHGGGASRDKWIRIESLSRDELLQRLKERLAGR